MAKVLLIDDEEINNLIFSNIIEGREEVGEFHFENNGWSALSYLENCDIEGDFPDLIFVDLNMPEMHGFDFIESYEEAFYSKYPETKVIILTSSVLTRDKNKAAELSSVSGFISKANSEEKLLEWIAGAGVV